MIYKKSEYTVRESAINLIESYIREQKILLTFNGPYNDEETIARPLSHLIIITYYEIKKFKNDKYIEVFLEMGNRLLALFKDNEIIDLRLGNNKDHSNGVIGHAWIIEALTYLYKFTANEKYISTCNKIIDKHIYLNSEHMWLIPNTQKMDLTFNHQLWYAACVAEYSKLTHDIERSKHSLDFLNNCHNTLMIRNTGLIRHLFKRKTSFKDKVKHFLKNIIEDVRKKLHKPSLYYKECGYQHFNITAFSKLYRVYPHHKFWNSRAFKKIIKFSESQEIIKQLESKNYKLDSTGLWRSVQEREINIYGFPYNVPGFAVFNNYKTFKRFYSDNSILSLFDKQIHHTFDYEKKDFGKSCEDINIIKYRIYEYYLQYYDEDNNEKNN